ncbi:MAG: cupin domain-containing protein [Acidobacteria bacterium]|nr:cupin domain-containing protein [Acidobacteriota bacterium]
MRNKTFFTVTLFAGIAFAIAVSAQDGGRGRGGAAPAVPTLATDKTMFWPATDIEARWAENERLKRNNSRLFNGPTNISANVRIVAGEDEPLVHETTADLWLVTAGTAVARTDGKLAGGSIANATTRPVKAGDVLYVPPGVPHHFTEMKGFRAWLMRFDTLGLVRTGPPPAPEGAAARGRGAAGEPGAGRGGRGAAAPPVPDLATDKTMFWTAADIEARWAEDEKLKRINSRIFNGPANISANVRIVNPGDPPATHEGTADLWLVTAGEAVARTDGEIVQANGAGTIRNGMARTVHAGDLLYVPPGVPHHFTDMKGFRAWLIRYDVEGWRSGP